MGILSEQEVGLESASKNIFACKGLRKDDETSDFISVYNEEYELGI